MRDTFREHARIVADHCLQVERGDSVVVEAPPVAEPLVLALAEALGERGAGLHVSMQSDRLRAAYLGGMEDDVPDLDGVLAAVEAADGFVGIRGAWNTAALADIPDAVLTGYDEATRPIQEAMFETDWTVTQFPAPGNAQAAEMSTDAYRSFVADAVALDWEDQRAFQQNIVDVLDPASEVHVRSDGTDIRFSVDGMNAGNEDGRKNLPGGEVGTAPVSETVEGEVLFDLPMPVQGTVVENARIAIEGGEVAEYDAERGESTLERLFGTDEGARRFGEFGIGMNRAITRPTQNTLFDEKMGDTVHFAFGFSLPPTVGDERAANESAVHEDLLVDMRDTGTIEIDGQIVYRDGTFAFEDGFAA